MPRRPTLGEKPLRRDAEANRLRMLVAAERVFAEQGLEASVDAVIAAAGVGAGTFYRRFPDKDALIEELLGGLGGRLSDLAALAELRQPDGVGLEWFLYQAGAVLQAHHGLLRRLWSEAPRPDELQDIRAHLTSLLRDAQRSGRISPAVAPADVSITLWALSGIIETSNAVRPDVWRRHLDVVVHGMRSPSLTHIDEPMSAEELVDITCTG